MRAFVTGGSGFVGRNLIAALAARGDEVRALARSDAAARTVEAAGARAVRGDLDDRAALVDGVRGCDAVFHSAAKVADWGPLAEFIHANVTGTQNALDAARAAGVGRFVHVGTEAVLVGGPPIRDVDETRARPERPIGPYSITKGLAEERVLAANGPGLAAMVVRPRLVWGAGDSSVLPEFADAVRAGRFMWIDGGRYRTSTCHVANVCEGLILAALRGCGGEIYFLTDGEPVEFREFLTAMLATQGLVPGDRSLPFWAANAFATVSERLWRLLPLPGRPPLTPSALHLIGEEVTVRDVKARRELGYEGRMSRDRGLAEMAGATAS